MFLTFSLQYSIPTAKLTVLVAANFGFQLLTDVFSPKFVKTLGYRQSLITAHILCGGGLILMAVLPELIGGFPGLLTATLVYAVGGGLLEVLISPVVESCPSENKSGTISLLHSFYCWGVVLTVLLSSGYFAILGTENWKFLSIAFAALPFVNAALWFFVPLNGIATEKNEKADYKSLFKNKGFILFLIMMLSSGAAEMSIAQWTSLFAESTLGVSKALGDVIGVCGFALMMAISRTIYGKLSERLPLLRIMLFSVILCIVSYLMISLTEIPIIGLVGCILCGFSAGIFWPGAVYIATANMPRLSTSMFALLALSGDIGCTVGPSLVGFVAGLARENLRVGILSAIIFPTALLICILLFKFKKKTEVDLKDK